MRNGDINIFIGGMCLAVAIAMIVTGDLWFAVFTGLLAVTNLWMARWARSL